MNTERNCPKCGRFLTGEEPQGLCPRCLMMGGAGLSECPAEGDQTTVAGDTAPPPPPPNQPSPVLGTVPYFGDYQLLEEIARGGMGVVYKARQVSLNRVVAVKMILAGQLARPEDVRRFHTEAEAAANLQHTNIVAIHEVGEHNGQHYFSMDFVEGKNLDALPGGEPMAAHRAAKLLKTISEAIHFAHQRGTLHRDIKPQNVLIDSAGQPRITDFGLAKQTGRDSGATQTGAILGSPAYMPPEQAAGKQERVGPQSDVYSLGATLYKLLTGRPPFLGDTPMATLRKVLEDEPVSPGKLNPKTPPDLETICLKCLEKRPERRYHSALELAEELGRFLNRQPILARPATPLRKLWAWSSQRPWVLTGILSVAVLGLLALAYGLWEQNRFLVWSRTHPTPARLPQGREADSSAFLIRVILLCALGAPAVFLDWVDRKSRGFSIGPFQLKAYGGLGLLFALAPIGVVLGGIHGSVWGLFPVAQAVWLAGLALPAVWFAALILWYVAREYRLAAFGLDRADEPALFPPSAPNGGAVPSSAEKRFQFNRFGLAILLLVLAAWALLAGGGVAESRTARGLADGIVADARHDYLHPSLTFRAAGRTLVSWAGVQALLLVFFAQGFRTSKAAGRHLGLLLAFFCGAAVVGSFPHGSKGFVFGVLLPPEFLPRLQAAYVLEVALGVAAGLLLIRLNRQPHPGGAALETGWPDWVKANPNVSSGAAWTASILLLIFFRDSFWTGLLGVFSMFIPWGFDTGFRAVGLERRARLGTSLLFATAAAMIVVSIPAAQAARSISVGLALGLAAEVFLIFAGRRLASAASKAKR